MEKVQRKDVLQQYLTELQNIREERQARSEQQHHNGTNENDAFFIKYYQDARWRREKSLTLPGMKSR
jgi:hypothetical protein